jgi:hypothetical protein
MRSCSLAAVAWEELTSPPRSSTVVDGMAVAGQNRRPRSPVVCFRRHKRSIVGQNTSMVKIEVFQTNHERDLQRSPEDGQAYD